MKITSKHRVLCVIGFLFITLVQCKKESRIEVHPSIVQLNESQVTISWNSTRPYLGKVYCQTTGTETVIREFTDKLGESLNHEVEITGLQPSTRYIYWIEGMEKKYSFQTKPVQDATFAFIVTTDAGNENFLSLQQSEATSFIISFNENQSEALNECSPYVPIFKANQPDWSIDWGGLRLAIVKDEASIGSALSVSGSHSLGLLMKSDLLETASPIEESLIHKSILRHNAKTNLTPVSFVGLIDSYADRSFVDNICYIGLARGNIEKKLNEERLPDFTVSINVDIESTSAYFLADDKEILLKEPPLKGKRTCQECRRLAEKGAYEKSIKAYMGFIETNAGHYQIDDAYFAIAEIYDGKLFQFPSALEWYKRLEQDFPSSNLVPLVKQRINYISEYTDNEFKPLAAFERIKTNEYAKAKNAKINQLTVLENLADVITQYPNSKLAPVMQLWMANQYQLIDVEKAIAIYNDIREKYPEFSVNNEVLVKIGETYYYNNRWKDSYDIYLEVASEFPELKESTNAQIRRIKRNLKRVRYSYVTRTTLILVFFVLLFFPSFGFKLPGWRVLSIGVIFNFVVLFIFAWLYREEFASFKEMVSLIIAFLVSIFLGVIAAYTFSRKVLLNHNFLAKLLGNVLGIIVFLFGFYQGIYVIYVHYLMAIGW